MDKVPKLTDLAILRLAADVCLRPDVLHMIMQPSPSGSCCDTNFWGNLYNTVLIPAVHKLNVPPILHQEVLSYTMPIALKIAHLGIYYENTFELTRNEIIPCLDKSVINSQGLVDNLKLGRKLLDDAKLSLILKYRLSCFHFLHCADDDSKLCIGNFIFCNLWGRLPTEALDTLCNEDTDGLLRVVSQELFSLDNINTSFSQETLFKIFDVAVRSGSIIAVKYTWENINCTNKKGLLVDSCLLVLSFIGCYDGICLQSRRRLETLSAPNDFYLEILFYLISQMDDEQKLDFVRRDVDESDHINCLKYVLRWPHQKQFIEMAELCRGALSQEVFLYLLGEIVRKLDPENLDPGELLAENIKAGDYRIILREFWAQSAEEDKKYVFSRGGVLRKALTELIGPNAFTDMDEENFMTIIGDATPE